MIRMRLLIGVNEEAEPNVISHGQTTVSVKPHKRHHSRCLTLIRLIIGIVRLMS